MSHGPTPHQQADYLVRKLEQVIRDNRTVRGMSFATWQTIAKEEIANAIAHAEKRQISEDQHLNRLALVGAAALVTIGFWGAVIAVDRSYGGPAALVFLIAGAALFGVGAEWGIRRLTGRLTQLLRNQRLGRIENLDRRIKHMERTLEKRAKRLQELLEEK